MQWTRFLFWLLLSFLSASHISANQLQKLNLVTGIWHSAEDIEDPAFKWKSNWIWHDSKDVSELALFRKSFQLSTVPDNATLRITASSLEHLYINGRYINRGPARSAPHHQSYDIFDITSLLTAGKNVIAIQVHYQSDKKSYNHDARAGLLLQIDYAINDNNNDSNNDSNVELHLFVQFCVELRAGKK